MKKNNQIKADSMAFVLAAILLNSTALAGFTPITIDKSNLNGADINVSAPSKKILNDIYAKEQLNSINDSKIPNIPAANGQMFQDEIKNIKPNNIDSMILRYAGPADFTPDSMIVRYAGPADFTPDSMILRYAGPADFDPNPMIVRYSGTTDFGRGSTVFRFAGPEMF